MTNHTNAGTTRARLIALALGLACALPVGAQTTGGGTTGATGAGGTTGTTTGTTARRDNDDDDFDWGWIGLLGLAGLAGLRRKPDVHRVDQVRTTNTR